MKRLFILVIALAVMPFASINAQDARNRVTSTIIADALATLPAENQEAYNKTMDELLFRYDKSVSRPEIALLFIV